ncbi:MULTISPECIES: hypothetical protein [unclassified Streptomyces]|uniref:hypothetical protein n=1 Tax=unclassified Streptomyces TaxID=2593676 RepID=UPI00114D0CD2|nr:MULTISPECIES: hypothetical protein [unclassified Streptomyces]MYZ35117.1 hypothetical protein [Streptomyces sp. SID4917]
MQRRIVHQIAEIHDVQLAVASVVIRPMLHELIASASWESANSSGTYRLSDGQCHWFYWHRNGASLEVKYYDAGHSEFSCPVGGELAPPVGATWLPHFLDSDPPPPGSSTSWRPVLRTASKLPLTLLKPGIKYYARHSLGVSDLGPDTFAVAFFAMAAEAEAVHSKWKGLPGPQHIRDSTGLLWELSPPPQGSSKPAVTGVLPRRGRPADNHSEQRARRMPGSSTAASGRRPTRRPF